ncbi:hypothetical protein ACFV6F_16030 [Kitasatospora phosalacinea]|uniref:hypothetical protein n=1 Tax=Kitasatospora phosalacinea TaxID=2065 RepID=UPI003650EF79
MDLPVPAGVFLAALAVPYLACVAPAATSATSPDRLMRLERNAPALGTLVFTAVGWWPHLADTTPVPAEAVGVAASYLAAVTAASWWQATRDLTGLQLRIYRLLAAPTALALLVCAMTAMAVLAL